MTISSVSNNSTTGSTGDTSTTATRIPKQTLGQDDFVKLLAVQFQTQDPMKPMEDTSFIAQMAQFTSLQQTSTMSDTITQLRADQQRLAAASYIGKSVTLDDGNGGSTSGVVSAVDNTSASPLIVVNGASYSLSAIQRVEAAPTSPTPSTTPSAP